MKVYADLLDLVDDTVGGRGSVQFTLFDEPIWLLALLVPVLVVLGTAVRRSLRQPGPVVGTSGLKTAAVIGAVTGLVAALLVRVSVSGSVEGSSAFGEASGSASVAAGASLLWAPLLGAARAAAAVWALRWGPTLALSLPRGSPGSSPAGRSPRSGRPRWPGPGRLRPARGRRRCGWVPWSPVRCSWSAPSAPPPSRR
jgi:hypothetical protein